MLPNETRGREPLRRHDAEPRPRVLITDAEPRWAVAACRSLADAGYRVAAASSVHAAAAHWSRFCHERLVLPSPFRQPEQFVSALERLLARRRYDVVLPASEAALEAVSEHRERFEGARLGLPPHEDVVRCLDKIEMAAEAGRAGVGPPPSAVCRTSRQADRAAAEFGYPVIVKPERTLLHLPSGRRRSQSSVVAAGPVELSAAIERTGSPFVVQRYEPTGRIISYAGVATEGGVGAVAVSRYRRTWPPLAGSAAFSVTIDPPPGLPAAIEEFVTAMGWTGVFEIELLERADGTISMIDFNPRLYGSISLAIASGANLPAIWCDWLLGRGEPTGSSRPGRRYRWEAGDAHNLIDRLRNGRIGDAIAIARPARHVVHPLFELRDPGPLLASLVNSVRLSLGRSRDRIREGESAEARLRSRP